MITREADYIPSSVCDSCQEAEKPNLCTDADPWVCLDCVEATKGEQQYERGAGK